LIRRVLNAIDFGRQTIRTLVENDSLSAGESAPARPELLREKLISETALLLLCVVPIRDLDKRIPEQLDDLAKLLVPWARHPDVRAAICLDPGLARDHAFAHVLLSRIGYRDSDVDDLLANSLKMGADFGPERLPHRRLEQQWLADMWGIGVPNKRHNRKLIADSMLGRTMDALGSSRFDIYAFTHAVMYASDLGQREIRLSRNRDDIAADAEAALGYSLDTNDFDLTAELLMTWPMLRLQWSSAATFAFTIITGLEDRVGFLPGLKCDLADYQSLDRDKRAQFAIATSYHTSLVMGCLCSVALREGCTPPATVPCIRHSRRAGAAMLRLAATEGSSSSCWSAPFAALSSAQQDSLASLVLAIALRRARTEGNLRSVHEALELALTHDLIDGPAPLQAAALLRRTQALKV